MKCDVLIIGGGPAGLASAIVLAKGGVKCILLERRPAPSWKPGEIFESTIQIPLYQLGLWDKFRTRNYINTSGTLSIWGGGPLEKSSIIDPYGGGYFVDRIDFEQMLQDEACKSGVTILTGAQVQTADRLIDGWRVNYSYNERKVSIATTFIIEATGRGNSFVGKGERLSFDSLVAILAYPKHPKESHDLRFVIESTPLGWSYMAPLPESRTVVAFLTDADFIPKGIKAKNDFYHKQIKSLMTLKDRICVHENEKKNIVSAKSTIRKQIGGKGWVAIGEAASTYDPLTGYGVVAALNKGIAFANLFLSNSFGQAVEQYIYSEKLSFKEYLKEKQIIYSGEKRFSNLPFWKRRSND